MRVRKNLLEDESTRDAALALIQQHDVAGEEKTPITRSQPNIVRRGWTYAKALAKWKAAGSPVRSQEEIEAVLVICEACEHYRDGDRPHCAICGCTLKNAPLGLKSKVELGTENCPIEKW